jgi:signal transduction histidine kinase
MADRNPTADRMERARELIRQLSETEAKLRDLLAGEADAVLDPLTGSSFLLREAQQRLLESESRLHLLLGQLPALIWSTDDKLEITSLLGAGLEALELQPDDLVGADLYQVQEVGGLLLADAHQRALQDQCVGYTAQHQGRTYQAHVECRRDLNGAVTGCLGVALDVTEQNKAQAALAQAERLALAGQVAATLAHEINNPLQSAIGCLGLAEEAIEEGEDVSRFLPVALDALRQASHVVKQLRVLTRPFEGEPEEPSDLNLLMEKVLELSRSYCAAREVKVDWQPAEGLPTLRLAPDSVQQVLLNLLLNGADVMPGGGTLQIATAVTSQPLGVSVTFTDSGAGIPPEILEHLFEPFQTTKPGGSGLGLFISQNIVEQHGGYIEAHTEQGAGTTFTVWLPV